MPDQPPESSAADRPEKKPYGPGILMVLGLFLLLVAAWCGYDLATKEEWQEEGKTTAIYFNWAGMIGFGIAAVYTFVLAARRATGGEERPPAAGGPASPEVPERPAVSLGAGTEGGPAAAEAPETEPPDAESDEEETPGDENAPPT